MEASKGHISVGVMLNSDRPSRWQEYCIDALTQTGDIDVHVIRSAHASRDRRRDDSFLFRVYRRLISRPVAWRPGEGQKEVADDLPNGMDVIVSLDGPVGEAELRATRLGAVWFTGLLEEDRCERTFAQVVLGEPVLTVELVHTPAAKTEPRVIQSGTVRAFSYSLAKTVDHSAAEIASWLAPALRQVASSNPRPPPAAGQTRTTVEATSSLSLLWVVLRRACKHLFDFLLVEQYWQVGVVAAPIEEVCLGERKLSVEWIPNPSKDRFLADPFGVKKDGTLHVLCEEYDFNGQGSISAVSLGGQDLIPIPTSMVFPTHVSYPFVFVKGHEVFCVPATAGEKEVALYRSVELPQQWTKESILLHDVEAVDSTLFEYDGRRWLACTMKDAPDLKLYLFYFDEGTQTWDAHEGNPVKIDIRSARPAGSPFVVDGSLYRPAQDSSLGYGSRITVNKVTKITPTEFSEEAVALIEPKLFGSGMTGLHTVSSAEDLTLVDVKRKVITARRLRSLIKQLM